MSDIVTDSGHGGRDPGASGNGIVEKDIVLEFGKLLTAELKTKGLLVGTTRDKDVYVGINERANIANRKGSKIFVSIHANAFTNPSAQGVETLYHPNSVEGKKLAGLVQSGILDTGLYTANRGIKSRANLGVLNQTKMPAILVELAFLTNKEDSDILKTQLKGLVTGVANGIYRYLGINANIPPTLPPKAPNRTWQVQAGIDAIETLGKAGLFSDPKYWKKQMEEGKKLPDWMLMSIMSRIVDMVSSLHEEE